MRILILGASSLLTKYLLPLHIQKQDSIDVLYFNTPQEKFKGVNYESLSSLDSLSNNYDIVYFIAAYIPHGESFNEYKAIFEANIELVVKACKKFLSARLIFCSSVSVYGSNSLNVTEEDHFISPNLYGLSKIAGEAIIRLHPSHAIIRFSSIYAAEMKAKTFLPLIVDSAINKGVITLINDPMRTQNYLHFSDAANMLFRLAELKDNLVLLGVNKGEYTNLEIANIISSILDKEKKIKIVFKDEYLPAQSFSYNADFSHTILNYQSKITIEEGLKEVIQWKKKLF
jgi:nucleoside-diphosphate-sugar epimerase